MILLTSELINNKDSWYCIWARERVEQIAADALEKFII